MERDRHYDEFPGAYARNLQRMLHGHLLTVGPEDREQVVTIDRIKDVSVGIDMHGIFVGIDIYDTEGNVWTLYGNGEIENVDHECVGKHDIKDGTLRVAV